MRLCRIGRALKQSGNDPGPQEVGRLTDIRRSMFSRVRGLIIDFRRSFGNVGGMGTLPRCNTTALDAANYLLHLAEAERRPIDPITLQKILFYCQCWSLLDGERLFNEPVEAWRHGPVVRCVWKAYSGSSPIRPADERRYFELDIAQMELIQGVWESLKETHGWELSKQTHLPGSAWKRTRGNLPDTADSSREIDPALMAEEASRIHREIQERLSAAWEDVGRSQR